MFPAARLTWRSKGRWTSKSNHQLELARYIVLNPVRAKTVKTPERYPWSSYRPMLGLDPAPPALATDWVLDQFARTKPAARKRYAAFVRAGVGRASHWSEVKGQVLLGGKAFVECMTPPLKESAAAIPGRQRPLHRPALKTLWRE